MFPAFRRKKIKIELGAFLNARRQHLVDDVHRISKYEFFRVVRAEMK